MKRYAVTSHSTGMTHELCDTLPEALCTAIRLQDSGGRPVVVDSQGTGRITIEIHEVVEIENNLGRSLGSDRMGHPISVEELLKTARATAPKKHVYHWDVSDSQG
ncbi:MAG: hypothetical protein ACK58L_16145 [Planctomycetota bacterium]